jgi:hypothetical protein
MFGILKAILADFVRRDREAIGKSVVCFGFGALTGIAIGYWILA